MWLSRRFGVDRGRRAESCRLIAGGEAAHRRRFKRMECDRVRRGARAMMLPREGCTLADETVSAHNARELQELERSRESAARLLDTLAQKVGANRAVRTAATGVQRAAHYVQAHSVKQVASGIEKVVRQRPAAAIAIAAVAGFLFGRALRSR